MKPALRVCALYAALAAIALAAAASPPGVETKPALAHLDLDIELDPRSRSLRAAAQLRAAGEFSFALHRALEVRSASADGEPIEVRSAGVEGVLRRWQVALPREATLRLDYGGTLPPLDRTLDHRGVLRMRAPMASGSGSFLPAGSGWYPQPAALFSYRVRLALPADQRGLVAGRLDAETLPADGDARYRAVFHFGQPADGIDLMAGPYRVHERLVARADGEPLRLRTYFFPDMEALAEGYLQDSERYIALYSGLIGTYPFSGFSVVASPLPTGFGMPSLTYIGAEVLKLPFIRATSLGHEVLHNWWGNGVYVDYAAGNWSEGLTTFMADYFYKERQSAAAARETRLSWLRDFAAVPEDAMRPLSSFRSRTHGAEAAVGYGKAAMVFFMLRDEIGEEAFRRGIRQFWAAHRFRVASWRELQTAFEAASGRALDLFFRQWLRRTGGPRIDITQATTRADNGKTALTLTLAQSEPAYALRVPVEIVGRGVTEKRGLTIDDARNVATLALDFAPEGVRLDPEFRLWRRLEQEALPPILRQWIVARAPRLLIASEAADVAHAAQAVARRLFEAPAELTDSGEALREGGHLLIVGLDADVDRALLSLGLPPRPATLADRGSAGAWTIQARRSLSRPIAVVSARDAQSLAALARPLPHYGRQSYLVFDGGRVIERGIWPALPRLVRVTRED